jgi:hypothetical protein
MIANHAAIEEPAMVGRQFFQQYTIFRREKRTRTGQLSGKISKKVAFDFNYEEVKRTYGVNGNGRDARSRNFRGVLQAEEWPNHPFLLGKDIQMKKLQMD